MPRPDPFDMDLIYAGILAWRRDLKIREQRRTRGMPGGFATGGRPGKYPNVRRMTDADRARYGPGRDGFRAWRMAEGLCRDCGREYENPGCAACVECLKYRARLQRKRKVILC